MFDTNQSILEFLDAVLPEGVHDFADQYGEPGYGNSRTETRLIIMATYWCRCDKFVEEDGTYNDGSTKLHSIDRHYPNAFRRLEHIGVELEWYDEWIVTHDGYSKAWRTTADSYSWQPSYVITEDGEVITIDDDVEEWIAYAANNSSLAIPATVATGADLIGLGFEEFNGTFENGWHPGQDDNPADILVQIDDLYGPDVDVVFCITETSQFYLKFEAYYRSTEEV